ncbi:MAG: hypothetical protein CMJ78_03430 [Planctomycetaceae bacterium]|nr:hypothetical protein [Planctomycetaceae bacterium]
MIQRPRDAAQVKKEARLSISKKPGFLLYATAATPCWLQKVVSCRQNLRIARSTQVGDSQSNA